MSNTKESAIIHESGNIHKRFASETAKQKLPPFFSHSYLVSTCFVFVIFHLQIIIIMYIYHALINALSVHMIHINLNIFYTHVKHSPTKTIYIKYYLKNK